MANRKEVFTRLNAAHDIPGPSKAALNVARLCQNESVSLSEIADAVQLDPILSSKLLNYANSAFMSTGIQVISIQKATVKLGIKTVKNLALCFSVLAANQSGTCRSFNYEKFWSLSLFQALAAKSIAELKNGCDPDEFFSCGLLADMGELTLASLFPGDYETILQQHLPEGERKEAERKQFDIDSTELTTELFLDWGLPAPFALAAGFHQDLEVVELGQSTTKEIAEILHIAHRMAEISQKVIPSFLAFHAVENLVDRLDWIEDDLETLYAGIVDRWYQWGETFRIPTATCPPYEEIRSKAA